MVMITMKMETAKRLYPDRTDDRSGYYWYFGCVALPAYQNYTLRAEFSETVVGTGVLKTAVEVCSQSQGLANVGACDPGTNGIPADVGAGNEVVGLALTGTAPARAAGAGVAGDTYIITATAPTSSPNTGGTFTLTGTLQAGGRIVWNNGVCNPVTLC